MHLSLKERRKQLKITQSALAKHCNVTARTVGAWERGESFPNATNIWEIAVLLGCSPNELLGWSSESSPQLISLSATESTLLKNYGACDPEHRSLVELAVHVGAMNAAHRLRA